MRTRTWTLRPATWTRSSRSWTQSPSTPDSGPCSPSCLRPGAARHPRLRPDAGPRPARRHQRPRRAHARPSCPRAAARSPFSPTRPPPFWTEAAAAARRARRAGAPGGPATWAADGARCLSGSRARLCASARRAARTPAAPPSRGTAQPWRRRGRVLYTARQQRNRGPRAATSPAHSSIRAPSQWSRPRHGHCCKPHRGQ